MHTRLLRGLGVVGWDSREPAILAALATEAPLLLIGGHGTAKSMLLERLAVALDLHIDHYNASTVNFDDLVGFPVPDDDHVRYLRTPLDAWDAEAVFIDELSRCRPDMQNRLFALIHERRLQGRKLERLRYRWSAMNPPPRSDADPDEVLYLGAEPLDAALADRFPWIIEVPERLSAEDRRALILDPEQQAGAPQRLREAIDATVRDLEAQRRSLSDDVARYVEAVADALEAGQVTLSGRRLRMLFDNIIAVMATGRFDDLEDAAWTALRWSLPERARGAIEPHTVARAHAAAKVFLLNKDHDLQRSLMREADPVARIRLALEGDDDLLATTLMDARAGLGPVERVVLSARLFAPLATHRAGLPGVVFEALGADVARVEKLTRRGVEVPLRHPRLFQVEAIRRVTAEHPDPLIADALWWAFGAELRFEPEEVVEFALKVDTLFANAFVREVA